MLHLKRLMRSRLILVSCFMLTPVLAGCSSVQVTQDGNSANSTITIKQGSIGLLTVSEVPLTIQLSQPAVKPPSKPLTTLEIKLEE